MSTIVRTRARALSYSLTGASRARFAIIPELFRRGHLIEFLSLPGAHGDGPSSGLAE